jgi:hypothetical protein
MIAVPFRVMIMGSIFNLAAWSKLIIKECLVGPFYIREDRFLTAILVLYCMPSDAGKWLSVYERSTTLRYCGYWLSLRGLPAPTNKTKRRIKIPKEQRFTESSLSSIMTRIKGGGFP